MWLEEPCVDAYAWVCADPRTLRLVGRRQGRPLNWSGLAHRRGILMARLDLESEYSEAVWGSEGAAASREGKKAHRPDGELRVDGELWAIEVEISFKSYSIVQSKIEKILEQRYQRVIYFCSSVCLPFLEQVAANLGDDRLEIRRLELPAWLEAPERSRPKKAPKEISSRQRELLARINEEGMVAEDQLAELTNSDAVLLREELCELTQLGLLEEGFHLPGGSAWVWCTRAGASKSKTGLCYLNRVGSSRLLRRRMMMAIRLKLTSQHKSGSWVTKRMLSKGVRCGVGSDIAMLVSGGQRIGILLSMEALIMSPSRLGSLDTFIRSVDVMYWYCERDKLSRVTKLVADNEWTNVEIREVCPA